MLIARFLVENAIRGFLFALLYAAAKFFIVGEHIGEVVFLVWFVAGTMLSIMLKLIDAIEIVKRLKELNNDN
jgi:hypothetical protein